LIDFRWVKFDCIGQQLLTAIANATDEAYRLVNL